MSSSPGIGMGGMMPNPNWLKPDMFLTLVHVHAGLFITAFFLLFPLGAAAIGLRLPLRVHVGCQMLGTVVALAGFAVAVTFSALSPFSAFHQPHQIIGLTVVGLLLLQSPLGWSHHYRYKRTGQRSAVSTVHWWNGRVLILVAMINAIL